MYSLWDGSQPLIDAPLELSPTAAPVSAFVSVSFLRDGSLEVTYLTGSDFEEAQVTIHVSPDRP